MSQRGNIVREVANLIDREFGPSGELSVFRAVRCGAWMPRALPVPSCTVVDAGAEASSARSDCDTAKNRQIKIQLVLEVNENFSREEGKETWTDVVDLLDRAVTNFDAHAGVKRMVYVNDDPVEVALQSGGVQCVWLINFECEYVAAFEPFGHR